MTVESAKFTRKKEQAIANLLKYPTIAEAAQATGVAEVTLFRWLQDSEFSMAFREARMEVVRHAIAILQHASSEAVRTLREIMTDTASPTSCRVTASRAVLEMAIKAVDIEELEHRIQSLESRTANPISNRPDHSHYTTDELRALRDIHERANARRLQQ